MTIPFEGQYTDDMCPPIKGTHILIAVWIIKNYLKSFTIMLSKLLYIPEEIPGIESSWIYIYKLHINMNATNFWPMAREYSVWNATVVVLQFWTAELKANILSSAIDQVYNTFFYSTSTHILCQQSDEILFSCLWPPWMKHLRVS